MTTLRDTQRLMNKYGVAWYKFDEPSGNTIVDSKGSFNGTAYNVTRVSGVSGNVLNFNGTNSYVQFNNKIIPLGEKSIRFKYRKETLSTTRREMLFETSRLTTENGISCYFHFNGGLNFSLTRGVSSSYVINGGVDVSNTIDGQWHDVLFTWDGTTNENGVKIYIDDMTTPKVQMKANYTETQNHTNNLIIGKERLGDSLFTFYNGELDEFEIYNKALTYKDLYPNKTLIKSDDNIHYTLDNGIWQPIAETLTQEDCEQYGMYDEDLQALTKADLLTLPNLVSDKPKVRTFKYR